MDMQEINKLIQTFSAHGLTCLELEEGNMRIAIKKELYGPAIAHRAESAAADGKDRPEMAFSPGFIESTAGKKEEKENLSEDRQQMESEQTRVIKAPLVGMFYNSSSPEEEPFVKAGDMVKKGQVIGIIEAMKLMNEITCDSDGVVTEVLVENGQVVEYGQPLFTIGGEA